jgi:hypothetical protein
MANNERIIDQGAKPSDACGLRHAAGENPCFLDAYGLFKQPSASKLAAAAGKEELLEKPGDSGLAALARVDRDLAIRSGTKAENVSQAMSNPDLAVHVRSQIYGAETTT